MALDVLDAPFEPMVQPGPSPVVPTRIERRKAARPHPWAVAMPWIVALSTLALRLATAAKGPTDWDSAQYTLAAGHFDLAHSQPQPPGYFLYVESGRLIHALTGMNTVSSLVLLAAVASAIGAGLTALAGRDLGGWWIGLSAGVLVAVSPFAWFSGSTVATYSFDMMACPLLIILAWRARPGSWHGIAAVVALGLLAGFRQSIVEAFVLVALLAVVGSTRDWRRLGMTALAGCAAVGAWLIPMVIVQPGGMAAWLRATRTEVSGAAQVSSVLDHAAGSSTNFGTFTAYTVMALAPLALLALVGGAVLAARGLGRLIDRRVDRWSAALSGLVNADTKRANTWARPWYQSRTVILAAAIVPQVAIVTLVQFAKGGYLLAYLPAATIALLLPLGAVNRSSPHGKGSAPRWLAVTSLGVVLVVGLGAQQFLTGTGVLPEQWLSATGSPWLVQPRYQAPYADTRATIRTADTIDAALQQLGPSIGAADVVVFDVPDGGSTIFRNAGWALPDHRIALVSPGNVLYNQLHGALYYASGSTIAVGPSGSALLVSSPALPGLDQLAKHGDVVAVHTPQAIGGYRVWRIGPGSSILGVRIVEQSGHRPLGRGI